MTPSSARSTGDEAHERVTQQLRCRRREAPRAASRSRRASSRAAISRARAGCRRSSSRPRCARRACGRGPGGLTEHRTVERRASSACARAGSCSCEHLVDQQLGLRTVRPRRITTALAACWLPRGNRLTATAARGASRPRRTSACTVGLERLDEHQTAPDPALVTTHAARDLRLRQTWSSRYSERTSHASSSSVSPRRSCSSHRRSLASTEPTASTRAEQRRPARARALRARA